MRLRTQVACIGAGLLVLLGSLTAKPQTAEPGFRDPFDFMVGRHMFPAGEYRVTRTSATAVRIEAARGIAAVTVASAGSSAGALRPVRLVFDNQGRPPQLLGVYGEREISRELAESKSRSLTVITARPALALAGHSVQPLTGAPSPP